MINRLQPFLTPPSFADEEKNRTARLLYIILYSNVILLVVINAIMIAVSIARQEPFPNTIVSIVAVSIFVGLIALTRQGFVQLVSMLLSVVVSGVITYSLVSGTNLSSLTALGYIIAIIIAGLLAGGRFAFPIAAVNFISFAVLNYLASQGIIQAQPVTSSNLITVGALFAMSAVLLELSFRATHDALDQSRKNELAQIKANQELIELQSTLEQRVAARTRDLATVAEVGTATATILESEKLLQEVVDLTKERFNLYHSHIYLLDEKGENLVLASGAGEPGRAMVAQGHSIPLDREQSLVARAARERKGVTVNDVTQAADFLPNPFLPDTHSELAIPMIVGGRVIGVFDIQSEQVGRFTESDVNIQMTMATQLATSIQNVRSFEQFRRRAELETVVNVIGQKIQRSTSIEETLQTAIRELGTAIGASRVKIGIGEYTRHNGGEGTIS